MKIKSIEIVFPIEVELESQHQVSFSKLVGEICDSNTPDGHVMWPAGSGNKITYMPMTQEEEQKRGIEFDESIYFIECFMRKKYPRLRR